MRAGAPSAICGAGENFSKKGLTTGGRACYTMINLKVREERLQNVLRLSLMNGKNWNVSLILPSLVQNLAKICQKAFFRSEERRVGKECS